MNLTNITVYALAWLLFAAAHSVLARSAVQKTVENRLRGWYRLSYNLLSVVMLAAVFLVGQNRLGGHAFALFDNAAVAVVAILIKFAGATLMLIAFTNYDVGRFIGITQILNRELLGSAITEPLQRHGLNRWMRHPLYTGAFLYLWGSANSGFGLWTAVWASLYLFIGSLFEERKLIKIYGEDYRLYQQEVARFFPRFV